MTAARARPQHRTIIAVDIEKFNARERTDPQRAHLQQSMIDILHDACATVLGDLTRATFGDTGDGAWIVIDPLVPTSDVVDQLFPEIVNNLRHYNALSSDPVRMRWRVAIHAGEVVISGPNRAAGEALNKTFRLLDSDEIHAELDNSSSDVVLIVSDAYYEQVIRHGYGRIDPTQYAAVTVQVKETKERAWILRTDQAATESLAEGLALPPIATIGLVGASTTNNRRRLTLDELDPFSLYLAISDVHNYGLYGRNFPQVPLVNQFETALLLAPQVVLHCADPFRSAEVAKLLTDYEHMVSEGSILFLLGENAVEPSRHFEPYINLKISQYGQSPYGAGDVSSLQSVDEGAVARTVELLDRSPIALTRGYSGTERFVNLVKADLMPAEQVATYESLSTSRLGNVDFTLRQLLQLGMVSRRLKGDRVSPLLSDSDTLDELTDEIVSLAEHNSFSRQIILTAIRNKLPRMTSYAWLDLRIQERIAILHLRATASPLNFLEVTHRRDSRSPFYYGCLLEHLSRVAGTPNPPTLGSTLVTKLRGAPEWPYFVARHLAIMSHVSALRKATPGEDPQAGSFFERTVDLPQSRTIRVVLEEEWA